MTVRQTTVRKFTCSSLNLFSDQSNLTISSAVAGVFSGRVVSRYNLNFENAKRFCELLGAQLATYNQLYAAWQAGLERCRFVL